MSVVWHTHSGPHLAPAFLSPHSRASFCFQHNSLNRLKLKQMCTGTSLLCFIWRKRNGFIWLLVQVALYRWRNGQLRSEYYILLRPLQPETWTLVKKTGGQLVSLFMYFVSGPLIMQSLFVLPLDFSAALRHFPLSHFIRPKIRFVLFNSRRNCCGNESNLQHEHTIFYKSHQRIRIASLSIPKSQSESARQLASKKEEEA